MFWSRLVKIWTGKFIQYFFYQLFKVCPKKKKIRSRIKPCYKAAKFHDQSADPV